MQQKTTIIARACSLHSPLVSPNINSFTINIPLNESCDVAFDQGIDFEVVTNNRYRVLKKKESVLKYSLN